jgi:recombination protein RecA
MELSAQQQSVLVGTLLGDGCLAKHGRFHRLHVKHKAAHIALVEYKHAVFADYVTMPLHRFDQQLGDKRHPCAQFATRTSPVFSDWHRRFYREGRKHVPRDIEMLLTPLAIAVWFMDDGAADYAGVTFQTHSFVSAEVDRLVEVLSGRFHLAANPRRNKGGSIIYVTARSLPRLRELVGPYLLQEFAYKLVPRRERVTDQVGP